MNINVVRYSGEGVKLPFFVALVVSLALWPPVCVQAQVSTGSNGSDGAFNPTTSMVVDMHDHPDGIYQYSSVNIPSGVTVTFVTNANNTPVTWLVQGNCVISGTVDVRGQNGSSNQPGQGGPGGGAGGYGGQGLSPHPQRGVGLGGGDAGSTSFTRGGNGSYATVGSTGNNEAAPGLSYGNKYDLPLRGGSGGGGYFYELNGGGGGGGGAMLIASDSAILLNGMVLASGGYGGGGSYGGGGGSGGGIRLLAPRIAGGGGVDCTSNFGGSGYVRLDVLDDQFSGLLSGSVTRGFNPILIAPPQTATLAIQSVAGNAVPVNPTGVLSTPDVTIAGQQANPIPVVVSCANIPLSTPITVVVKPVNGVMVLGSTVNSTGTLALSTATASLNMPRGGGIIYATAVIGVGGSASLGTGKNASSYAETGLTTDGERFTKMEITAGLGGGQEIAYITESGKRLLMPK
jgi:hypothetical protein